MRLPTAALLASLAVPCTACSAEPPPNVVLIVMDTTRADRCSVNGYGRPTTPQLEALAAEGVVYENAWSPAGWTGPAHASLFTGLRPERHGFHRANRHYILPGEVTLAESLQAAGYRTAAFTNNITVCAENGLDQGFDTFTVLHDEPGRHYPWATGTHAQALDWVRSGGDADRPFFLFVNDMEPHLRYTPPPLDQARFVPSDTSPESLRLARASAAAEAFAHNARALPIPAEGLRLLSDLYDAEIACLDREIGRLIDGLREAGLLERTVVIVTSDHGENLGEHGLTDHMFSIHRTIRHVPLVVRYPDRFEPGTRVTDVVRLEDLHPTLLEICGLPTPGDIDGVSLLDSLPGRVSPALVDAPDSLIERRLRESGDAFDPQPLRRRFRGVFDGRHHYIRDDQGGEQLFDVVSDPAEADDLAASGSPDLERMRRLLADTYPDFD